MPIATFSLVILFDGEREALFALCALAVIFMLLCFASWALAKYFGPRLGRRSQLVATIPFIVAALAVFADYEYEKWNAGPPTALSASVLAPVIKALPSYVGFSLEDAAYFDGDLYVGTNLGLLQIQNGIPKQLFRFQRRYSVVSGPWFDQANHLLWVLDEPTRELVNFDGKRWIRTPEPVPVKGDYSRGEVLEGFRPAGNKDGFWIASAGSVWRWNAPSVRWDLLTTEMPKPPDYDFKDKLIGVLPIGSDTFGLFRHEALSFLIHEGDDFTSDDVAPLNRRTAPIGRGGEAYLADSWVVTPNAAYICSKQETLMRATSMLVTEVRTPGPCDAVAVDSDDSVVVSIRRMGVYRLSQAGQWTLIGPSPYPSGEGEFHVHLAASGGEVALVMEAMPVIVHQSDPNGPTNFTHNAPTKLWTLQRGQFKEVQIN